MVAAVREVLSKLVGRSQEYIAFADQNRIALLKASNFVFTDGVFNCSTLSNLGRNLTSSGGQRFHGSHRCSGEERNQR